MNVESRVLARIKPTPEEQFAFSQVVKQILEKLTNVLPETTPLLGGSAAKGTWLRGQADIDVFFAFGLRYTEDLAELLAGALAQTFGQVKRLPGSRDYFQVPYGGYVVEVVPIRAIHAIKEAKNITDCSPFHTQWVRMLPQKIKNDIMLLKQWCKGQRLYGAESYIAGFSGYVLEILVAHYGSFAAVLRATQQWKLQGVIDLKNHYPKKDATFHINSSKLSPLVVVDPVDPLRNAAAAVSKAQWLVMKKAARAYLQEPTEGAFFRKPMTKTLVRKLAAGRPFVVLSCIPKPGKRDAEGARVVKAYRHIHMHLKKFKLIDAGWEYHQKGLLWYVLGTKRLPAKVIMKGPPIRMTEAVAQFRAAHKETFVQDNMYYARVSIPVRDLNAYVKGLVQDPYIRYRSVVEVLG